MGAFDFDVAVIGGGSAGYAAARTTAAAGKRTVIIEAGGELGGLCILRGCMPTKALLHAADVRFQARRSKLWGLEPGEIGFDYASVMRRKAAMVEEFAGYRRGQLRDGRFELTRALAKFRDPHMLELDNGQAVPAGHFMVSTGSRVAELPLPGLAKLGCMTSDDALELESLPKSVIVLGGGAVSGAAGDGSTAFRSRVSSIFRSSTDSPNSSVRTASVFSASIDSKGAGPSARFIGMSSSSASARAPAAVAIIVACEDRAARMVSFRVVRSVARASSTLVLARAANSRPSVKIRSDAMSGCSKSTCSRARPSMRSRSVTAPSAESSASIDAGLMASRRRLSRLLRTVSRWLLTLAGQ